MMTERGSLFSAERRELIDDCDERADEGSYIRDSRPYHTTERTTSWASIISL